MTKTLPSKNELHSGIRDVLTVLHALNLDIKMLDGWVNRDYYVESQIYLILKRHGKLRESRY